MLLRDRNFRSNYPNRDERLQLAFARQLAWSIAQLPAELRCDILSRAFTYPPTLFRDPLTDHGGEDGKHEDSLREHFDDADSVGDQIRLEAIYAAVEMNAIEISFQNIETYSKDNYRLFYDRIRKVYVKSLGLDDLEFAYFGRCPNGVRDPAYVLMDS